MLGVVALVWASDAALAGKDVDTVKAPGTLICGDAAGGIAGFMMVDSQSKWTEEGQACSAVGPDALHWAAVGRGRPAVEQLDLTLTRNPALGLDFVGITYYDGKGFMVPNYGEAFDRNLGPRHTAQDRPRPQQAVDAGRPAVRAANPVRRGAS